MGSMEKKQPKTHFLVTYRDPLDNKVVELKANQVRDSELGLTFVAVSDFVFETPSVVVDPAAEELRRRFADVRTLHLALHCILSIQEVGRANRGLRFQQAKSNLVVLPGGAPPQP